MTSITGGHVIVNKSGTSADIFSEQLINMLGMTPQTFLECIYMDDVEDVRAAINVDNKLTKVFRVVHADGHIITVRANGQCPSDKNDQIILVLTDISACNTVLSQLAEAKADAERALQAKSRFLAAMSHEIRTPLNGIIGLTDLLRGGGASSSDETRESIETINLCSNLLLTLINNILDYSKLEEGKLSLNKEKFNLQRCCEDILAMLTPKKSERVDILLDFTDDSPTWVVGDQVRVTQILTNIVGNAVKFTSTGYIRLTVRHAHPSSASLLGSVSSKYNILFIVEDTGVGISKDNLGQLFKTYNQGDQNKHGGTGLGLCIARALCRLMSGDISVSSVLGEGSTFTVSIWLDTPTLGGSTDSLITSTSDIQPPSNPLKILAAEDNKVNQTVLAQMLGRLGYTYDIVEKGLQAVNHIREGQYDVVLMDWHMPVMDGFAATKMIRDLGYTQVKIIALTANAMKEDKDLCLSNGFDDYISKPVSLRRLREVLASIPPSNIQ